MPAIARDTVSAYLPDAKKASARYHRGDVKPLHVSPRIRTAIDAMVHERCKRADAAERAGIKDHALRAALRKPHVLAYLNEQMEVLRTGARPHALNRIIDLMDTAASERVQLDAATYLDGMDRTVHQQGAQQAINVGVNVNVMPGYVIDLSDFPGGQSGPQIQHLATDGPKSLESNDDVPDDE